jgi:hypothetical protein
VASPVRPPRRLLAATAMSARERGPLTVIEQFA